MKKDCEVVPGNAKCRRCLKGKKGCRFSVEGSGESEIVEDADVNIPAKKSPIASLKEVLTSPIRSLRKRKETDLSPEAVKEKESTSSSAIRVRRRSPSPEFSEVMEVASTISVPPPSMISNRSQVPYSSHLFFPSNDYRVRHLQSAFRESQEDLSRLQERFASKESLYLAEIADLKQQMEEGSSAGRK